MTLRTLPAARVFDRPQNFQWDAPSDVLARWAEVPVAAAAGDATTINIYDVIGEDFWTGGGFTAKRMAGALRSAAGQAVTVNVNSPGGDMFEGIAIYNMLRDHPAAVTVNVMGWAASAASVIAMAGDTIRVGLGTFVMIHNAWGGVVGNRHDMRQAATLFDGFDAALADIYEARTGLARAEIVAMMDAETFMGPSDAVAKGFADEIAAEIALPDAANAAGLPEIHAKRRLDALLASANVPRSERRRLLREATGAQDAAGHDAMRDAGIDVAAMERLISTMKI